MLNPSKIESLCKWTFKLFSWPITHSIPFFWSQIAGQNFQIFNFSPNATRVSSTWLSLECLGPMNLKGGNSKTCSPKPCDIQWYRYPSVCLHDRIIISQLFLPSLECWWYLSASLLDSNRCSLQIKSFFFFSFLFRCRSDCYHRRPLSLSSLSFVFLTINCLLKQKGCIYSSFIVSWPIYYEEHLTLVRIIIDSQPNM